MRLYLVYLGVVALAILFVSPTSAFELFHRQKNSIGGNFTSTSGSSPMTASDNSSSSATTRMIVTGGTMVSSETALHGPSTAGSSSTSATATGGSSSGQGRAFGHSASGIVVGIIGFAGIMAFNMI